MPLDEHKIDRAVLALLYLGLHDGRRAWRGFDWDERIMMPLSLRLTERCDAVLRIGGASKGADDEVERFQARGLRVFRSVDEIPDARRGDAE